MHPAGGKKIYISSNKEIEPLPSNLTYRNPTVQFSVKDEDRWTTYAEDLFIVREVCVDEVIIEEWCTNVSLIFPSFLFSKIVFPEQIPLCPYPTHLPQAEYNTRSIFEWIPNGLRFRDVSSPCLVAMLRLTSLFTQWWRGWGRVVGLILINAK